MLKELKLVIKPQVTPIDFSILKIPRGTIYLYPYLLTIVLPHMVGDEEQGKALVSTLASDMWSNMLQNTGPHKDDRPVGAKVWLSTDPSDSLPQDNLYHFAIQYSAKITSADQSFTITTMGSKEGTYYNNNESYHSTSVNREVIPDKAIVDTTPGITPLGHPLYIPNRGSSVVYTGYPDSIPFGGFACGQTVSFGRSTIGHSRDSEHIDQYRIIFTNNQRGYLSDILTSDQITEFFLDNKVGCSIESMEIPAGTADHYLRIRAEKHDNRDILLHDGDKLSLYRYVSGGFKLVIEVKLNMPEGLSSSKIDSTYTRPFINGSCHTRRELDPCVIDYMADTAGANHTMHIGDVIRGDALFEWRCWDGIDLIVELRPSIVPDLLSSKADGIRVRTVFAKGANKADRLEIKLKAADTIVIKDIGLSDGDRVGLYYLNNVLIIAFNGIEKWAMVDPIGGGVRRSDSYTAMYFHAYITTEEQGSVLRNFKYNGLAYRGWETETGLSVSKKDCGLKIEAGTSGTTILRIPGPMGCQGGELVYSEQVSHPSAGETANILTANPLSTRGYLDIYLFNASSSSAIISIYVSATNTPLRKDTIVGTVPIPSKKALELKAIQMAPGESLFIISSRSKCHVSTSLLEEMGKEEEKANK